MAVPVITSTPGTCSLDSQSIPITVRSQSLDERLMICREAARSRHKSVRRGIGSDFGRIIERAHGPSGGADTTHTRPFAIIRFSTIERRSSHAISWRQPPIRTETSIRHGGTSQVTTTSSQRRQSGHDGFDPTAKHQPGHHDLTSTRQPGANRVITTST